MFSILILKIKNSYGDLKSECLHFLMGNVREPKVIWVANDFYSPPFHGGNTGPNPVGIATTIFKNHFYKLSLISRCAIISFALSDRQNYN